MCIRDRFRDYLRRRKLAFALKEVRDSDKSMLYSIVGKLDDHGGSECNSGSGQVMAYINDPEGRLCDWGIERTECYGAVSYTHLPGPCMTTRWRRTMWI